MNKSFKGNKNLKIIKKNTEDMPKTRITSKRATHYVFADLIQTGLFGSDKTGSPTLVSGNVDLNNLIGSPGRWRNGLNSSTIVTPEGNEVMPMEEMNSVLKYESGFIDQITREGVLPWDAGTNYTKGSLAKSIDGSGIIYKSLTNNNIGNDLSDSNFWKLLQSEYNSYFVNPSIEIINDTPDFEVRLASRSLTILPIGQKTLDGIPVNHGDKVLLPRSNSVIIDIFIVNVNGNWSYYDTPGATKLIKVLEGTDFANSIIFCAKSFNSNPLYENYFIFKLSSDMISSDLFPLSYSISLISNNKQPKLSEYKEGMTVSFICDKNIDLNSKISIDDLQKIQILHKTNLNLSAKNGSSGLFSKIFNLKLGYYPYYYNIVAGLSGLEYRAFWCGSMITRGSLVTLKYINGNFIIENGLTDMNDIGCYAYSASPVIPLFETLEQSKVSDRRTYNIYEYKYIYRQIGLTAGDAGSPVDMYLPTTTVIPSFYPLTAEQHYVLIKVGPII